MVHLLPFPVEPGLLASYAPLGILGRPMIHKLAEIYWLAPELPIFLGYMPPKKPTRKHLQQRPAWPVGVHLAAPFKVSFFGHTLPVPLTNA
jgi:hypothetical protein